MALQRAFMTQCSGAHNTSAVGDKTDEDWPSDSDTAITLNKNLVKASSVVFAAAFLQKAITRFMTVVTQSDVKTARKHSKCLIFPTDYHFKSALSCVCSFGL